MFHNISNPEWFGNWSRLEDDYLGNGGTDIADNFTFSKRVKTGGLFGSIISLATAFPACDPETGHATGAWKVACESIDLDEVPLSDIADMISGFDCETITDFRLFNTGAFDNTSWQQALGELLLRLRVEKEKKAGNSMREPNFNCLGATPQVPTLIERLYACRNALSSCKQVAHRRKPHAYSRSRAIWHPGATRSVPQDLLLEHPQ